MAVALRVTVALLLSWPSAVAALEPPWPAESSYCSAAIATAERSGEIPFGLLAAIGRVESCRPDPESGTVRLLWPWAVNIGGAARFFASKAEAVT
jgi:hypothetical protein